MIDDADTADGGPIREPLISFEHRRSRGGLTTLPKLRPDGESNAPGAPFDYRTAVSAFRDRFPAVGLYTAWNEPNNGRLQPTNVGPETPANGPSQETRTRRAGQFWRELNRQCANDCVAVAGDFLDDASLNSTYRSRYFEGMGSRRPAIWAYHAYGAVENGEVGRRRLRAFLDWSATAGRRIWLTEQGAYRYFPRRYQCARGTTTPDTGQSFNAARDKLQAFFNSGEYRSSKVRRFYYYSWIGDCRFDTGLISPPLTFGATRPVYDVLDNEIKRRP